MLLKPSFLYVLVKPIKLGKLVPEHGEPSPMGFVTSATNSQNPAKVWLFDVLMNPVNLALWVLML